MLNWKGGTRRIFTKGSCCYISRTTRIECGSRIGVYSHNSIIHNYITHIILPVSPRRPVPTPIYRHINVARVLVNNHASAWELVVYERGDGPGIKTVTAVRASFCKRLYIFCQYYRSIQLLQTVNLYKALSQVRTGETVAWYRRGFWDFVAVRARKFILKWRSEFHSIKILSLISFRSVEGAERISQENQCRFGKSRYPAIFERFFKNA